MKGKSQQLNKADRVSLWQLFWTFFKTGLFTFGGGYAMISILEEELVSKKKWVSSQYMLDMLVIAESTPGVIAVNTATSVGFHVRGVLGAIIATIGVVLPSFLIITALSFFLRSFAQNTWYKAAFTGVQACVTVLVVNAFIKMASQLEKSWFALILVVASFAVALFTDFNVIYIIIIGGVVGILYTVIADAIVKKKRRALPPEQTDALGEDALDKHTENNGGEQ